MSLYQEHLTVSITLQKLHTIKNYQDVQHLPDRLHRVVIHHLVVASLVVDQEVAEAILGKIRVGKPTFLNEKSPAEPGKCRAGIT